MPRLDLLRRFGGSTDGNVAMLFAFMSLPLLAVGGAAIDYGFAMRKATNLQAATDATLLALCQTPQSTTAAQLSDKALAMMQGYMGPSVTLDPLTITSNPRQITLTARINSAVMFGKLTGTAEIQPKATARCATPMPRTFEIAMVLDNTGSMMNSGGDGTKMDALKSAATKFVTSVYDDDSFAKTTRLSLVPFAGAVAIPAAYRKKPWIDTTGKSRYHMQNVAMDAAKQPFSNRLDIFAKLKAVRSNWDWAGCLETLPYPLNVQDGSPVVSNDDSYFVPMFAPDEPGDGSAGTTSVNNYSSTNSYLNDDTGVGNCTTAKNLTYMARLSRACKYSNPTGTVSTTSNASKVPNGPNYGCTTQPLMTLTSDRTTLNNAISNLVALGSTNIHEGVMWGWRTLSPLSVFSTDTNPPSAYTSDAVNKIMIVMSDGENMWPASSVYATDSFYTSSGYVLNAIADKKGERGPNSRLPPSNQNISNQTNARAALDALTQTACSNAKSTGITIYTIGFSTSSDPIDAKGMQLLEDCASTPSQFYTATDSDALMAAFDEIRASIGKLRLTL